MNIWLIATTVWPRKVNHHWVGPVENTWNYHFSFYVYIFHYPCVALVEKTWIMISHFPMCGLNCNVGVVIISKNNIYYNNIIFIIIIIIILLFYNYILIIIYKKTLSQLPAQVLSLLLLLLLYINIIISL